MMKLKSKIEAEIEAMAEAGFRIDIDDGFPCCCDMVSVKTLGFTTNPSGYLNDSVMYSLLYTTCSLHLPIEFDQDRIKFIVIDPIMADSRNTIQNQIKFLRGSIRNTPAVDLNSDFLLFVPTHIGGNHWYATVLFFHDKVMYEFCFNSLYRGRSTVNDLNSPVKDIFMHYCDQYFKNKSFQWIRTDIECPNQDNGYDCGIFTLGKNNY